MQNVWAHNEWKSSFESKSIVSKLTPSTTQYLQQCDSLSLQTLPKQPRLSRNNYLNNNMHLVSHQRNDAHRLYNSIYFQSTPSFVFDTSGETGFAPTPPSNQESGERTLNKHARTQKQTQSITSQLCVRENALKHATRGCSLCNTHARIHSLPMK